MVGLLIKHEVLPNIRIFFYVTFYKGVKPGSYYSVIPFLPDYRKFHLYLNTGFILHLDSLKNESRANLDIPTGLNINPFVSEYIDQRNDPAGYACDLQIQIELILCERFITSGYFKRNEKTDWSPFTYESYKRVLIIPVPQASAHRSFPDYGRRSVRHPPPQTLRLF